MDPLEQEIKNLIISSLKLEDLSPEELDKDESLFGPGGLGLDSIDALELGVAVRKAYGLKIDGVTEDIRLHFSTVAHLAAFIRSQKGAGI